MCDREIIFTEYWLIDVMFDALMHQIGKRWLYFWYAFRYLTLSSFFSHRHNLIARTWDDNQIKTTFSCCRLRYYYYLAFYSYFVNYYSRGIFNYLLDRLLDSTVSKTRLARRRRRLSTEMKIKTFSQQRWTTTTNKTIWFCCYCCILL